MYLERGLRFSQRISWSSEGLGREELLRNVKGDWNHVEWEKGFLLLHTKERQSPYKSTTDVRIVSLLTVLAVQVSQAPFQ